MTAAGFGFTYSGGVLTVTAAGTAFIIDAGHKKRDAILDILKDRSLSEEQQEEQVIELLRDQRKEKIEAELRRISSDDVEVKLDHGVVTVKGQPVNNELTSKLLEMAAAGIPYDGLINFMINLAENPSAASRSQLFKFLEHRGFPITPEGYFLGYRGVRADFKDRHSGRFDNSPGNILEMPREDVCADPGTSCAPGFHVGTFKYATGWAGNGKVIVVKVNPADAVSVPNHDTEKLRVCKFEVIRVYEGDEILAQPVYSEEEIQSDNLLENDQQYRTFAADLDYEDPFDSEEEEEDEQTELDVHQMSFDEKVAHFGAMGRDDVCREAARTGIFFSTNEARDMGKDFVVEETKTDLLIKLAVRRGLFTSAGAARKKGRKAMIARLEGRN